MERTNAEGALNARKYGQKLYSLGAEGEPRAVGRATSDGGQWLDGRRDPRHAAPPCSPIFFDEMWPVLRSSAEKLTAFIASDAHEDGGEVPGKTFTATPGFEAHQTGDGALTHPFEIRGVRGRRMVVPYQIWMLQRLERVLAACTASESGRAEVEGLLSQFACGTELLELGGLLAGCRVRKEGARLFAES